MMEKYLSRSLRGRILFLANRIRPNIMFSVIIKSQFMIGYLYPH